MSLVTQGPGGRMISYTTPTHSRMVSSVKVSVAAMENLLHGSVWSYSTQHLMILRCAFAHLKALIKMLLFNCLRYTSSNTIHNYYVIAKIAVGLIATMNFNILFIC